MERVGYKKMALHLYSVFILIITINININNNLICLTTISST